eukprot:SAG31_NODE_12334_length_949_cov_1.156471_1_plen_73_part_10
MDLVEDLDPLELLDQLAESCLAAKLQPFLDELSKDGAGSEGMEPIEPEPSGGARSCAADGIDDDDSDNDWDDS